MVLSLRKKTTRARQCGPVLVQKKKQGQIAQSGLVSTTIMPHNFHGKQSGLRLLALSSTASALPVSSVEGHGFTGCGKTLVLGGAALQRCVEGLYFHCGL